MKAGGVILLIPFILIILVAKAVSAKAPHLSRLKSNQAINCQSQITSKVELKKNLNCPNTQQYALALIGDNAAIEGNGFSINAPNAQVGILSLGNDQVISNLKINVSPHSIGISAYESDRISITHTEINSAHIGISLDPGNLILQNSTISNNVISNSKLFGIYILGHKNAHYKHALIESNSLTQTGNYALHLYLSHFLLSSDFDNDLSNSLNGIYFSGQILEVEDFSMDSSISATSLYIYQTEQVRISDSIFQTRKHSGPLPRTKSALHIHESKNVLIQESLIADEDIGVKITISNQKDVEVHLLNNEIRTNLQSAIMLQSYSDLKFKNISIKYNDLSENPADKAIWLPLKTQSESLNIEDNDFD